MSEETDININNYETAPLPLALDKKVSGIRAVLGGSSDLLIKRARIAGNDIVIAGLEGMISNFETSRMIMVPLMNAPLPDHLPPEELFGFISGKMLLSLDTAILTTFGDIISRLMSGFAVIMTDGVGKAFCAGIQGFAARGISEPSSEGSITAAHEGFTETIHTNISLVRRRIRSPLLQFRLIKIGTVGKTEAALVYMNDRVPHRLIRRISSRLKKLPPETVLGYGSAEPFIVRSRPSLFSAASTSERPDVVCAKLIGGRICLLIDGTPYALIVPAVFSDNFQTVDDYNFKPYYAAFIRIIRYCAFIFSIFLPGVYVAVAMHHREILRSELLLNLACAEMTSPLPIASEALIILLFYEIIREAGIRLPKSIGGAVSLIGGLILGDAAVSAGIITDPMLLVCAISVTAAFVIPSLNQPVSILRLLCVAAGGVFGLFGISLAAVMITADVCSLESFGVPVTSPLSPFTPAAAGDIILRESMEKLSVRGMTVEKYRGADIDRYL